MKLPKKIVMNELGPREGMHIENPLLRRSTRYALSTNYWLLFMRKTCEY